jgi:DNA polymerase-3 subunit epsilon
MALLDRVLEDRHVDDSDADSLVEMATRMCLSGDQISRAHREYLNQLVVAAVADGIVSDAERRDLKLVVRLLGQEKCNLDEILREAAERVSETPPEPSTSILLEESMIGMSVCFTGDFWCHHEGQNISRELGEEFARKAGLVVANTVTKKLDLLVVADPHTQSGKAKKARQYGIRIMHEPVFWKAIGVKAD